ncbi:hypothetical protein DICPUDRAFT_44541 [Dictyostelium purpureum]|uniref:FNIP repeat-containing protein n=1 Tax=Dictyostelium purpureum TaxID=5786 RepID=F0Z6F4_DICPU|nr:uncharacterized protein DICPUDRAFT_44541 [Dictyostelium purpureum]EGC40480.1 hypothetical protein DICPUDRAFT_44541 [Dictyostelium purpureum]|eukprot:XP_003283027.1 hypothetical protein DICPUDRAFT_44541 [Dictyostelium purpureum]
MITHSNSNNSNNNNIDSNNSNIIDNSTLFFKIWRNRYLFNLIIYFLKNCNLHYYNVLVRSYLIKDSFINELKEGYITSLTLYSNASKQKLLNIFQILPKTIESIQFGDHAFNEEFLVGEIPHFIERIVFNLKWNRNIELNVLPSRLKTLVFNQEYNSPILPNVLPPSLTHLEFGNDFNHPLGPGVLNQGLKVLKFSHISEFNQKLQENSLPSSLETIRFGKFYNKGIKLNVLPPTLTHLEFLVIDIVLPSSFPANNITYLKFGNFFNFPIKNEFINLKKLKRIQFGDSFDQPLGPIKFPESITCIEFGEYFNRLFSRSQLPKNLKHLVLGDRYTRYFDSITFPTNLVSLRLNKHYWRDVTREMFPTTLKLLELGLDFKLKGEDFLPPYLDKLIIRGHIQRKSEIPVLPSTLTTLFIHTTNKYLLDHQNKEESLESLKPIIKFFSNSSFISGEDLNTCDYLFKKLMKRMIKLDC